MERRYTIYPDSYIVQHGKVNGGANGLYMELHYYTGYICYVRHAVNGDQRSKYNWKKYAYKSIYVQYIASVI